MHEVDMFHHFWFPSIKIKFFYDSLYLLLGASVLHWVMVWETGCQFDENASVIRWMYPTV